MNKPVFALIVSEYAQTAYDALTKEERIGADALFERLRHWHSDPTIRSESTLLEADNGATRFRIDSDVSVTFEVADDTITVSTIEQNANRDKSQEQTAKIKAGYEWAKQQQFSVEEFETGMREIEAHGGLTFDELLADIDIMPSENSISPTNAFGQSPTVEDRNLNTDR